MKLLQQRKLAFACACAELIKVGKNLPWLLQNLDKMEHEEEQAALQGHIGEVSLKLSLLNKAVSQSPRCRRMAGTVQARYLSVSFLGVGSPERFGERSFQHEHVATQFGSDVF